MTETETYDRTCLDCGAPIRPRRFGKGWIDRFGATVCRIRESEKDGQAILVSADYHYVGGETQRRFTKKE